MGRYNDISRGSELQDAYEKYQTWLRKSRREKKAAYRTVAKAAADRVKTERQPGYILPFNSESEQVYLEARIIDETQTGQGAGTANIVRGLVDDRALKTMPTAGSAVSIRAPRYKFAKIIASQRTNTATTESESRMTDTPYKRHRSDNVSSPFGRKSASDNFSEAVKEIRAKAAFRTFVGSVGNRIGFTAEGS